MKLQALLYIAAITVLSGCANYTDEVTFKDVNEITLSDVKAGEEASKLITIDRFANLVLTPTVTQSKAKDDTNLTFEWKIRENTVAQNPYPYYELGTSKSLDAPVNVAVGIHRVIYTVTDKLTGMSKFMYYNVKVIGEYSEGWTILEETADGGDISMILPTKKIVRNIYSKENGEFLQTPCVSLSVATLADPKKLFILTQNKGVEVSYQEYTKLTDFENWFVSGTAPTGADVKPQLYKFTTRMYAGMINNDKFHARIGGGFPGDPAFGGAIPAPVEADGFRKDYFVAKFIVGGFSSVYQIIYDNLQKRFMYLTLDGLTPCLKYFALYDSSKDAFDSRNTGMEMLYMDDSNVQYIHNALMRDDDGNLFIMKFNSRAINDQTVRFPISSHLAPSALKNFTTAVSSKLLDHMYVAVGNRIYHYDIPAGSVSNDHYQFASVNEQIVSMQTINVEGVETLYVATNNNNVGTVYYFPLEPSGEILNNNYSEKFEGFGKIVDFKYKN